VVPLLLFLRFKVLRIFLFLCLFFTFLATLAFLALLVSASAFVSKPATFVARETSLNMIKSPEGLTKGVMAAVAGVVPAIMSSTAAVATEGTGEWFGVDDTRLLGVLFAAHFFILGLYLSQYGDDLTSTDDDFFGEIDYSSKK